MLNKNNKNKNLELTAEAKDRKNRLQTVIDHFEEVALKYGPISSEELKNRINKIIRNFDGEFKKILEIKFEEFWNTNSSKTLSLNKDDSNSKIPKFLKNYKK
tara:strand:- start:14231 stop:14536 length:306 start_codon:yes stop_codon:yes gene_type:complete